MASSISEVARRANVSISTVSRVLNRPNLVNAKTRERVEIAIRELGYHPNAFARGLMLRKSEMIGLVLPDIHGEFYSEIIRGANLKARELGYNLILSSANDPQDTGVLLEGIRQRRIMDGVAVMVAEVTDQIQGLLHEFSLPFVLLDSDLDGLAHDSVVIDQHGGAVALMRHLVHARASRRVIYVGGHEANVDAMARCRAYREVLANSDLPCDAGDIHHLDFQYATAHAFALEHLHHWVGPGHCVFAGNDEMASAIIDAAYVRGFDVPRDLAVVGFDDTRIARMTRPPLTTVRVPMAQMGGTAVELLCERLAAPESPERQVSLRPELVVRPSCGATG